MAPLWRSLPVLRKNPRLHSKLTDTMGSLEPNRLTFIYLHCCLRGAAVIVGLKTTVEMNLVQIDRNRQILAQFPSSQFQQTIHNQTGN